MGGGGGGGLLPMKVVNITAYSALVVEWDGAWSWNEAHVHWVNNTQFYRVCFEETQKISYMWKNFINENVLQVKDIISYTIVWQDHRQVNLYILLEYIGYITKE